MLITLFPIITSDKVFWLFSNAFASNVTTPFPVFTCTNELLAKAEAPTLVILSGIIALVILLLANVLASIEVIPVPKLYVSIKLSAKALPPRYVTVFGISIFLSLLPWKVYPPRNVNVLGISISSI